MNPIYIAVALVLIVAAVFVLLRLRSHQGTPTPTLKPAAGRRRGLLSGDKLSESVWTELENDLIAADVGPGVAGDVTQSVRRSKPQTGAEAREALERELVSMLGDRDRSINTAGSPGVVVVVGVNGAGKTTTIAKLADRFLAEGETVVLGAADTYRAAADAQLKVWGDRVGVSVVTGPSGSDPAAVAYEAIARARTEQNDIVIIDTAGRLHTQKNLMEELSKLLKIVSREVGATSEVAATSEVLLVLDGTTGQNGIVQARIFTEAVGVTGVVITKLDGTSRGGIVIAVEHELGLPVKFIGTGEGMGDLKPFVPADFAKEMLAQ